MYIWEVPNTYVPYPARTIHLIRLIRLIHPSIHPNEFSHNDSGPRNSDLCIPYLPHNLSISITCYRMYQRNQLNTTYQHRPFPRPSFQKKNTLQTAQPFPNHQPSPTPPLPSSSLSKKISLVLLFGSRSSLDFGSLLYLPWWLISNDAIMSGEREQWRGLGPKGSCKDRLR